MQYRKRKLCFVVPFLIFVLMGCKKKVVHCKDLVSEIAFTIAFVGFSAESLDTIVMISYPAGSGFSGAGKIDTVFNSAPVLNSDTFKTSIAGRKSTECKIYLPDEVDTFRISEVKYRKEREWDEVENCNGARMIQALPDEIKLNDSIVQPGYHAEYNFGYIYLKKK